MPTDETERHPQYFEADFDGEATTENKRWLYNGEISVLEYRDSNIPGPLLAKLRGVDVAMSDSRPYRAWTLDVSHDNAADGEHDAVHLLRLRIENPLIEWFNPGQTRFIGVIKEIYAYAQDDGPFQGKDRGFGYELNDEVKMCEGCGKAHKTGQYLAPKREEMKALIGAMIMVTLTPLS